MNTILRILMAVAIIAVAIGLATATTETGFNYTDSQTATQVSEFTITAPDNQFVGAIQIADIDPTKITRMTITADTYSLDIVITNGLFNYESFVSTFHDNAKGTTTIGNFSELFLTASEPDQLWIPDYTLSGFAQSGLLPKIISIKNNAVIWDTFLGQPAFLINPSDKMVTFEDVANQTIISPAKSIHVVVTGSDKVDIIYFIGSTEKIAGSTYYSFLIPDSNKPWYYHIIGSIPFIGDYINDTISLLAAFFFFVFSAFKFFVEDFDIIVLSYLTFAMIHGIMLMSAGGTPIQGIIILITDFVAFAKLTIWIVVSVTGLIWRIVHAIAQVLKPI